MWPYLIIRGCIGRQGKCPNQCIREVEVSKMQATFSNNLRKVAEYYLTYGNNGDVGSIVF